MITIATSIIGVILAATSAYALSRYNFRGRSASLVFLLTTQMIPAAMLMVPLYILAIRLGLIGTYRGLIFAYAVTAVPFSIWLLKGYYDTVPIDLEEAARIDGASELQAFTKILLPLSTPALAIALLFNFTAAWNEYLFARIILGGQELLLTWPLGLQRFNAQFQTQWGSAFSCFDPGYHSDDDLVPLLREVAALRPDTGRRKGIKIKMSSSGFQSAMDAGWKPLAI